MAAYDKIHLHALHLADLLSDGLVGVPEALPVSAGRDRARAVDAATVPDVKPAAAARVAAAGPRVARVAATACAPRCDP